MMDFDLAASRLAKDQQSALARSRAQRAARTASAKALREAAAARAKAEKRLKEKKLEAEKKARVESEVSKAVGKVERVLGVVDVGDKSEIEKYPLATGWVLEPTSIHGEGDKISLPPSVLEELTSSSNSGSDPWGSGQSGRPLAFRVGILNPNYTGFPSSTKMKALVDKISTSVANDKNKNSEELNVQSSQPIHECIYDSDDETEKSSWGDAYLDELSHRYLAYTHGTVVEFTQEDGCVGLPEPIARALLTPNKYSLVGSTNGSTVGSKKTVDPASTAANNSTEHNPTNKDQMDVDLNDGDEKTPGHLAYGKFEIPASSIEIIPIKSLPPGKNCTFTPTRQSVLNGFYTLKDIKLVLEQSLIRTRATLSRGDVIRTWRRGVSFDLIVSEVSPADYATDFGVVSCVNTDLNVDIGPAEGMEKEERTDHKMNNAVDHKSVEESKGRTLAGTSTSDLPFEQPATEVEDIILPPEPEEHETSGVCIIQIRGRGSNSSGRRRFKTSTATMGELFAFARSAGGVDSSFRLVTRFPRKVYKLSELDEKDGYKADASLESAGITQGQILFMIEH